MNLVAVFELVKLVNFKLSCANVVEVSLSVVFEVRRDGKPEGPLSTTEVVFIDNSRNCTSFSNAGTIANEKTSTAAVGEKVFMLLRGVDD